MTQLRISGLAAKSIVIRLEELAALGTAVRVSEVVAMAEPRDAASHGTVISRDGSYRASIPLADLMESGWLALGQDGLRLTVTQGSTLCWNVKDVAEIHLAAEKEPDSVPEKPKH